MTDYGVLPQGFSPKRQSDIISEINAQLQATFGANVNLGAESVLGQLVGVFSEREALLWEDLESVYASQFPSGAEGVAVDNILALSNLKRLGATPSVTDPTPATQPNGIVLRGLVLYGTPGTPIPAGSQIKSSTSPPLTFKLDADVIISAASSGQQAVVLSNVPTSGAFKLGLVGPSGSVLYTPPIPYNTYWTQTQLLWTTGPTAGSAILMLGRYPVVIDWTMGAAAIQAYARAQGGVLAGLSVTGFYNSGLTLAWAAGFHPNTTAQPSIVAFSAAPTGGTFTLTVGTATTAALPFGATATAVQTAIAAIGYPDARVAQVAPVPQNVLPANVRRGTDAALGLTGLSACDMLTGYGVDPTAATAARTTAQNYEGTGSVQVTGVSGRQGGVCATAVPVTAGAQYTFSAYVRCATSTLAVIPAVTFSNGTGSSGGAVTVNATGWTRVTQTVTVPAGVSLAQCAIGLSAAGTQVFYVDAWQMELGATPNTWVDGGGVPGFAINWGQNTAAPTIFSATSSLTGPGGAVAITTPAAYGMNQPVSVVESLQALINNLRDFSAGVRPFTDVQVVDGGASQATVNFGAFAPLTTADPASGSKAQPQMVVYANTLAQSSAITNVAAVLVSTGSPAQGSGTATCTVNGPNALVAGQLSVIGSPIAGWSGVTNQLDVLPGRNVETDTQAMQRRAQRLAINANGPLDSIVQRVAQLSGVTQATGFANGTAAALQLVQFDVPPTSGAFRLVLGGGATASIPCPGATSAKVQEVINAIAGYAGAIVTGGTDTGFIVDFSGSQGGQAQPLMTVVNNTTPSNISITYGRYPNSVEIVVEGGSVTDIAQAIYDATPAGIATYGTPAARPSCTTAAGSNVITVGSAAGIQTGQTVVGRGIAAGSVVTDVSGTQVTMSAAALQTNTSTLSFLWAGKVTDAFGNPVYITFSRAVPLLFYVSIQLLTDQYLTPSVVGSGSNPRSRFKPASVSQVQQDIVAIGNAVPTGGTVIGYGTGGLIGAFNEVPGILGYTLTFGLTPNPLLAVNIPLLPTQTPLFEALNVQVAWS